MDDGSSGRGRTAAGHGARHGEPNSRPNCCRGAGLGPGLCPADLGAERHLRVAADGILDQRRQGGQQLRLQHNRALAPASPLAADAAVTPP
jgi:hypothetical protein